MYRSTNIFYALSFTLVVFAGIHVVTGFSTRILQYAGAMCGALVFCLGVCLLKGWSAHNDHEEEMGSDYFDNIYDSRYD